MPATSRRIIGLALAVASAVTVAWSVAADWYDGRQGTSIGLLDLVGGLGGPGHSGALGSLLIPVSLSALLVLAGIVVWWRGLWVLGGLVAVATAALWALRQAETGAGLHAGLVGAGPWMALCGGLGGWLAVAVAGPRPRVRRVEDPDRLSPEWKPAAGTRVGETERMDEPRRGDDPHYLEESRYLDAPRP